MTVTIHLVASLDGFIARKDNSISWFDTIDQYENGVSGDDPEKLLKTIDCYLMGSHTYEHALELSKLYGWPYGDIPTIVLSSRKLTAERSSVEISALGLAEVIDQQLQRRFKNVWLVGGAQLVKECLRLQLANEIRLSVLPIVLGDGLPFVEQLGIEQPLHLKNVTAYKNAVVELHYEIKTA